VAVSVLILFELYKPNLNFYYLIFKVFIQMASAVYFGMSDGTVEIIQTK
jgi:hypothetical protein